MSVSLLACMACMICIQMLMCQQLLCSCTDNGWGDGSRFAVMFMLNHAIIPMG